MFPALPPLAYSLEFHNPDDHGIHLDNHWGGILFIVVGILMMFGPLTSYRCIDLTRWLRFNFDERPVGGFERFVLVTILLVIGIYLLTHPSPR